MGVLSVIWKSFNIGFSCTSKDLTLFHTGQLKPMIKAHSSGKKVSSGISDVVITSVHSENASEEVNDDDYDGKNDDYDKSQEKKVFSGRQKLTSAMKLRPDK